MAVTAARDIAELAYLSTSDAISSHLQLQRGYDGETTGRTELQPGTGVFQSRAQTTVFSRKTHALPLQAGMFDICSLAALSAVFLSIL